MQNERITIMLDGDLARKLRMAQADFIEKNIMTCSFSKVVNSTLRKGLK